MLFLIYGAKLLKLFSPYQIDQQGSPCCHNFMTVTQSYNSKVTPNGDLHAEKITEATLLYVSTIALPASLF